MMCACSSLRCSSILLTLNSLTSQNEANDIVEDNILFTSQNKEDKGIEDNSEEANNSVWSQLGALLSSEFLLCGGATHCGGAFQEKDDRTVKSEPAIPTQSLMDMTDYDFIAPAATFPPAKHNEQARVQAEKKEAARKAHELELANKEAEMKVNSYAEDLKRMEATLECQGRQNEELNAQIAQLKQDIITVEIATEERAVAR